MNRAQTMALAKLIDSAEAGGYTLPAKLLDAWRTYQRVKALDVPTRETLSPEAAAARIVSTVAAAESPDVTGLARELANARLEDEADEHARGILARASDQAGEAAITVAYDLTETIISKHLAPALAEAFARTREAAAALDGYGLDLHRLMTAPAKVRNAYADLPALAAKRQTILTASKSANAVGNREPQRDTTGLFADFRKPLTFFPTWRHPARIPAIPFPADQIERLLWFVGDAATAAEPWLPTMAERDAAWEAQFGDEERARATRNIAARAYAGQAV